MEAGKIRQQIKGLDILRIMTHNLKVVGSNPTPATKKARKFKHLRAF